MDLNEIGQASIIRLAGALTAQFGTRALPIVEAQIEQAQSQPRIAQVWSQIAHVLRSSSSD